MKSADHPHGMTLRAFDNDTMTMWNVTIADIVQQFGLPGDRYVTDVTVDAMTFWFRDPHDALLFKLCHGYAKPH